MKYTLTYILNLRSAVYANDLETAGKDIIKIFSDGRTPNKIIYTEYVSVFGFIWYLLSVFIFIMLIQYLFSDTLRKAADTAVHQTFRSILLGLLFFVAVPIVVLVLMATLLGIPLALLVLFAYILLVLLCIFISSVSAANWINRLGNRNWGFWLLSILALSIFVVLNLLLMVPVLGWVILGIFSCLSFGSVLMNVTWIRVPKKLDMT